MACHYRYLEALVLQEQAESIAGAELAINDRSQKPPVLQSFAPDILGIEFPGLLQ